MAFVAQKFRKKPVVIEAVQWRGTNQDEMSLFLQRGVTVIGSMHSPKLVIVTLEGEMNADVGDWIIRGVAGEFYPCKPHIFTETYEPA